MDYNDATRFLKDHIISKDDFEAKEAAINAEDGTIVDGSLLTLKDFKMGDNTAQNVTVVVRKGMTSSFIIGENFISKQFGKFNIDKAEKVIVFE